ncbi:MAG TPA: hypothetical protein VH305_08935 [Gaiella sp.]|jgi:hypothetical protein
MSSLPSSARRILTKRWIVVGVVTVAVLAVLVPAVSARQQDVPVNTAQPVITGNPAVGQTLTVSNGTWTTTGDVTYTYDWRRCPASGGAADASDCASIGTTTATYVVAAGDVGFRLRARVTAQDAGGQATVASDATAAVTAQSGPPNTAPPTITGSTVIGEKLTANPGTWTGSGVTFAYLWSRCDATGGACADLTTATQSTYTLVTADSGKTLRVKVTGTNASGSNSVTSAQTAVVTSGSAPTTGCPTGTGAIDVDDLSPPARLQVDKQQITPAVVTPGTKTIRIRFHVSACQGRSVEGALVYATPTPYQQFSATEQPTAADGWAVLTMRQLRYFPASNQQQLLVVFVRARKNGEDLLAGISTRRLVSFKVNLRG